MSKDIIVHYLEGYSASSKKNIDTISNIVGKSLEEYKDYIFKTKEFHSRIICNSYKKSINYINETRKQLSMPALYLIGKSLGAIGTLKILDKIKTSIGRYRKINVLLIDPRSFLKYGTFVKEFFLPDFLCNNDYIRVCNVYQTSKGPKGISIPNANIDVRVSGSNVDHHNIVNHEITTSAIIKGMDFLSE